MKKAIILAVVALMMVSATAATASPVEGGQDDLAQVRRATAAYHRVQKVLEDPDFGPFALDGTTTPTCFDDTDQGGMGVHYVRAVGDGVVDAHRPEAMVYEVGKDGRLALVAVEYVVLQSAFPEGPPELFGETFTAKTFATAAGPLEIYKLHVWLWKANPNGMFADYNPLVRNCPSP